MHTSCAHCSRERIVEAFGFEVASQAVMNLYDVSLHWFLALVDKMEAAHELVVGSQASVHQNVRPWKRIESYYGFFYVLG